jgi:hypothetical protein
VVLAAGLSAWGSFLGVERTEERDTDARRSYEHQGWVEEGPPQTADRHGARLVEPRYVKRL